MNQIEWYGSSVSPFVLDVKPSPKSTLMCNFCKMPPMCVARCDAYIYYVFPKNKNMTHAYIHLGN